MKFFYLRRLADLFKRNPSSSYQPRKKRAAAKRRLNVPKLEAQGGQYDLMAIYNLLNQSYFENKLELKITWFGSAKREARRHRKLGLYCFNDKLIKIHRLLDQPHFPPYFISYVVYHEMLHSVCPPIKAKRGRYRIHHCDFKKKEMEFAEYAIAKRWEEENKKLFFHSGL